LGSRRDATTVDRRCRLQRRIKFSA
jgi:hypothetical protein